MCLRAVDGSNFKHSSMVEVHLRHGDRMEVATAYIVNRARSILGIQGLIRLGFLPSGWPDNSAPVAALSLGNSSKQIKASATRPSRSEETVKVTVLQEFRLKNTVAVSSLGTPSRHLLRLTLRGSARWRTTQESSPSTGSWSRTWFKRRTRYLPDQVKPLQLTCSRTWAEST